MICTRYPPPEQKQSSFPLLDKALEVYKLWQGNLSSFPRLARYSLGGKIDREFTDLLERLLIAAYAPREEKYRLVISASAKLDLVKFFFKVAWEMEYLDHKKYAAISTPLNEMGKMVGGWLKQIQTK